MSLASHGLDLCIILLVFTNYKYGLYYISLINNLTNFSNNWSIHFHAKRDPETIQKNQIQI